MVGNFLTLVTFILGVATCVLSVVVSISFWRREHGLRSGSRQLTAALKWQLIGEAIIGLGTLVFATAAFLGVLSSWSTESHSVLRIAMFIATSVTTLHLYRVVRRLQDGN